jgi:glycosyltransferase involved in cell wall biosynthesis
MKLALVHDHLNQFGGAERVLLNMSSLWPESKIYTLLYDKKQLGKWFADKQIEESFISRLPGSQHHFKWYLPLMPAAVEQFNFSQYDVVLSSVSGLAKGVIVNPESLHICYCHTPTRYLWSDTHTYTEELHQPWLVKKILPPVLTYLRMWDYIAAQRVDIFLANSQFVARRIKKYYHREARVIYPPVDTSQITMSNEVDDYFLMVSRLRPYKRVDIAVKAFNKLGLKLKIIGTGEEEVHLKKLAKPNIEFLGSLPDVERNRYYSRAKAFINPQEEDFGITVVEAMAAGTPVIAYRAGGATESVTEGVSGTFFDEQSWEALADAVIRFDRKDYNPQIIRNNALQFDSLKFKQNLQQIVLEEWEKFYKYSRVYEHRN